MVENHHQTEAACLVEHGAQYHSRVGLKPSDQHRDPIFAGFRSDAFSLFFGDSPFYHFDLEGRWQRAVIEGTHWLKGLDGTVQVIRRAREERNLVLERRLLTDSETVEFDARIRSAVTDLIAQLDRGCLESIEPPAAKARPLGQSELRQFLERIVDWDSATWAAQRARYLAAYGSCALPFLPPDCQNAVVLQATSGNAGGAVFGGSGAGASRALSTAEFQCHANRVAALWGRRVTQSRVIFLGGSELLRQPVEQTAAYLDAIGGVFPIGAACRVSPSRGSAAEVACSRLLGVHMILDDFLPARPDSSGFRELARRGLVRVSLGIESGDPEVREHYRKAYSDVDLSQTVRDLKSAGLGLSVMTLVGAGGVERAAAHLRETARLIASLELGPGDFVFLLDENEIRGQFGQVSGLTPLDRASWMAEQVRLKDALAPLKKRGVKVLPYTFDKQSPA